MLIWLSVCQISDIIYITICMEEAGVFLIFVYFAITFFEETLMWDFMCFENFLSWLHDRFMWIVHDILYAMFEINKIRLCWCIHVDVNSRVPKTVRHGTSLHRICPKLSIDSSTSRLESQTSVRQPAAKLFGSSPIQLESQASFRRPTLKLFGSSPSRLESTASVRWPSLKLFGSSPSRLYFDRHKNCWLTSHPSFPRPSQPLTTYVLDVCHPPVTETKMSPIVCTAQN